MIQIGLESWGTARIDAQVFYNSCKQTQERHSRPALLRFNWTPSSATCCLCLLVILKTHLESRPRVAIEGEFSQSGGLSSTLFELWSNISARGLHSGLQWVQRQEDVISRRADALAGGLMLTSIFGQIFMGETGPVWFTLTRLLSSVRSILSLTWVKLPITLNAIS